MIPKTKVSLHTILIGVMETIYGRL